MVEVGPDGQSSFFAADPLLSCPNGPALEASFCDPNDLAFSPDGKTLYVNENASTIEPHTVLAALIVRRIRL